MPSFQTREDYKQLEGKSPYIYSRIIKPRLFRLSNELISLRENYTKEKDPIKKKEITDRGNEIKKEIALYQD